MITTTEEPETGLAWEAIDVDGDEILSEFTKVMLEWGHYRAAPGLTFPSLAEAVRVAAGRRDDRGWNLSPIP
jgi:hypothetical protein